MGSKKINRRDFIKITGMGTGGLMLATPVFNSLKGEIQVEELKPKGSGNKYPTYCEICFWKCAGWVHTNEKDEIWKITGNDDDPHSNGRFCPRGTGGVGMYYDEDRLKTPLIRTEERGKQVFREASWEEAFDYIAEKWKKLKWNTALNVWHCSPTDPVEPISEIS